MGTALSDAQAQLLSASRRIILALDGDGAGQKAAQRGVEQALRTGRDVRVLALPEGLDPDEVIGQAPQQWQDMVERAAPAADWLIETECTRLPADASIVERETLARALAPALSAMESNIYRRDNLQKLALRLRLPVDEVLSLASRSAQAPFVASGDTPTPVVSPYVGLENYCLRGLLLDSAWMSRLRRLFRSIEVEAFGVKDFAGTLNRQIFELCLASYEQVESDPDEYVRAHLDSGLWEALDKLGDEPLIESAFIQQCLRLRLKRLKDELEQLALSGEENLDLIRARSRDKACVLAAMKGAARN
jgi:DNA primase